MTFFFGRWADVVRSLAFVSVMSASFIGSVSAVERLTIDLPIFDVNVSLNLKGARTHRS